MITCKLIMSAERVSFLQEGLSREGEERVKVVEDRGDGYNTVEFEVRNQMEVLYVFHAGVDAGVSFALWGPAGNPKKREGDLVEIERG